jgi:ParB family chromosome partitioning protein
VEKRRAVPTGGSEPRKGGRSGGSANPEIGRLEQQLRERFATKVAIHHNEKKGRIEIEYYGNNDLDRVLALLGVNSRYDML